MPGFFCQRRLLEVLRYTNLLHNQLLLLLPFKACMKHSIMPTLQQSLRLVADDTNHESPQHKSRRQLSWFVLRTLVICVADFRDMFLRQSLWTLLPSFPVHCIEPNSIRATQTGLLRTCHGLCRKHLDMSRWFVSATFVICVGNFHQNFMVSWFVTVCVCNFHDLCPRLSSLGSFGESRHTGIWA